MADFLIQSTLSNFVVAFILAIVAAVVQRRVRSASLSNLLWALVLVKLVTPPLVSIPVMEFPAALSLNAGATQLLDRQFSRTRSSDVESVRHSADGLTEDVFATGFAEGELAATYATPTDSIEPLLRHENRVRNVTVIFVTWLVISAVLFLVSSLRLIRFHRLLTANSSVDDRLTERLSCNVARQFGLCEHPDIVVTQANVAPFVWWRAIRSVIVISKQATVELSEQDLRLVVAHEMAHIKRRDHWFRWLEWTALIVLWWNPVMWWARHQLRASEEMACDNLVLDHAAQGVHEYANALLNTAELLTTTAFRPPVVASAINSGGGLEQRLKTMIADNTWKVPTALRTAIMVVAICVAPLGFVYAQDLEAVERRLGGAVEAGELTLEQASLMMDALRRSTSDPSNDMRAKKIRYIQREKKIKDSVESGNLSEADAERKLIAVRREMFEHDHSRDRAHDDDRDGDRKQHSHDGDHGHSGDEAHDDDRARDHKQHSHDGDHDHNGDVAHDNDHTGDHDHKDPATEHRDHENRDLEAKKHRYMQLAEEIKIAVAEGVLSPGDAEKKLVEIRREMFADANRDKRDNGPRDEDRGGKEREMKAKMQRYMEFSRYVAAELASGILSQEAAEKKLIEVRREMFDRQDRERSERGERNIEALKRRYIESLEKAKAAAEASKISQEVAEKKLIEVREKMLKAKAQEASRDSEVSDE